MRYLAVMTMALFSVTACLGSDFSDGVAGSWQLTSGTVDGEKIPILDSHPITITFEGERVSGTASCNQYGGTFELEGSSIALGDLAMTEMACFPEEVMVAEQLYGRALTMVQTVALDGDLTLSGQNVDLVFSPGKR